MVVSPSIFCGELYIKLLLVPGFVLYISTDCLRVDRCDVLERFLRLTGFHYGIGLLYW